MKSLYKYSFILFLSIGLISMLNSCKKPTVPTVTTASVTEITESTAKSGGEVTNDGGEDIIARGVCWGPSENPTTADNKTSNGTGLGSFTSELTELTHDTKYYVRAFASNSKGVSYGDNVSFTTEQIKNVTDKDGNVYNTVYIGDQVWMKENLKTTKYNDNTPIPNVTGALEWSQLTTGAYCWYSNKESNKEVYGGLYNWYAVNTGKLCPTGWHVPSDEEWHELATFLDPGAVMGFTESTSAGGKLKETGTTHWTSPNTDATNTTNFNALPGGYRNFDGVFNGVNGNANFRTSTVFDAGFSWYRYLNYQSGGLYRTTGNKEGGFSVRCIMD